MTAGTELVPGASPVERPSPGVIVVRIVILLIAVGALLSPVYVAIRGTAFLNQPPPPFYGVHAGTGTGATSTGAGHKTAGFGGC